MSSSSAFSRFQTAMDSVYGPLPSSSFEATIWTPPPNAGGFKGRYLWTDAFGVINFITLFTESQDELYLTLAKNLVEAVHNIQGRTRDGRTRLPGATDENPLGGGLRIGKEDESGPDGDGQYHHYLTIWMFALNRLSLASKESKYNDHAIQLAKAIHPNFFTGRETARPRMVWKIAVDMSRPLVRSEGNLDPIDGYITMRILQAASHSSSTVLEDEIGDYKRVIERKGEHFASDDMLDLGMSLWSSHWLAESEEWTANLEQRCLKQIELLFAEEPSQSDRIRYRLAFRDFGAVLGIRCSSSASKDLQSGAAELVGRWERHLADTPPDLRPITQVMYAAALIPGAFRKGYLSLGQGM